MKCPNCGSEESRVTDSRNANGGLRRRRECLQCGFRFTTYERIQTVNLLVIKKDQRREEFNREKLGAGIRKACEKRPLPAGTIEKIVDEIESELLSLGKPEVPSSVVGERVMERLKKLDHIAYIRFASVYRAFADLGSLKQEVDTLIERGEPEHYPDNQLPLIPGEELNTFRAEKGAHFVNRRARSMEN